MTQCWHHDQSQRPAFDEILDELHHLQVVFFFWLIYLPLFLILEK